MIQDSLVEAVASALYDRQGYATSLADAPRYRKSRYLMLARKSLEAAEPHIQAEAWGDGYLAGLADMQNGQERPNPYRSQDGKDE